MNDKHMRALVLVVLFTLACAALPPVAAQPTVVLSSTTPERGDPLEEITLNLTLTNTTAEAMWNIRIWFDLSDDTNGYFVALDDIVEVDLGEREYLSPNDSVTTSIRIMANTHTPAQKHQVPLVIRYRRGACEGGCQNEEARATLAVPIYRMDPKVAISIQEIAEVFPGEQLVVYTTLNNFGTGIATSIEISASTSPSLATGETTFFTDFDPPELGVSGSVVAQTVIDTTGAEPGYYQFTVGLRYEDKYGNSEARVSVKEFKIKGTATQEALYQANMLRELGINAYQLKDYTTAISYLERAIELYGRLQQTEDILEDISLSEEIIQLSITNIQASNYYQKGNAYFADGDFVNAKRFYTLAYDIYVKLNNTKLVAELNGKIAACDDELYRYDIMDSALYGAVGLCGLYGIIARRKEIAERLKRK
ncbi:MAG: tetratricopeptide repeat protein [Candidatus Methanofastidiosa archaeon]|nr:tetratricopeptide repeat protein [Candidatus Methanofastidiosa archaeon]